jgi:hypothetical protein
VFINNNIRILANIGIANPTQADLLPRFCAIQGFIAFDATQTKKRSYHDQHFTNQFLLLTIEVFGCLHK